MRSSLSAMPRSSWDCSRSFFTRSSPLGRETPRIGSPLFLESFTLRSFPDSSCSTFPSFFCFLQIPIASLLSPGAAAEKGNSRMPPVRRGRNDTSRFPLFLLISSHDRSPPGRWQYRYPVTVLPPGIRKASNDSCKSADRNLDLDLRSDPTPHKGTSGKGEQES